MHAKDFELSNSADGKIPDYPHPLAPLPIKDEEKQEYSLSLPDIKRAGNLRSNLDSSPKYILNKFRGRIPWKTMTAILKVNRLPVGRGWTKTIHALDLYSKSDLNWLSKYAALYEQYKQHLLVGEKALQLFKVEKQQIDKLVDFFLSYEPEVTVFHAGYPFPLDQEQLKQVNSERKLVSIEDQDNYIALVFCSKRTFTRRVDVSFDLLKDDAKKDFSNLDKIMVLKEETRQYFDVIAIPKEGDKIEVRIDISTEGGLLEEKDVMFYRAVMAFNLLVRNILGIDSVLKEPVNLFPLVHNLYDSTEGRVCEIGFTTDEGSIKLEKLRRVRGDLRTETYHKAGKSAVDHIALYRLGVSWKFSLPHQAITHPEVLLPGKVSILSSIKQQLNHLLVTDCSGSTDYNFILSIILKYLGDTSE